MIKHHVSVMAVGLVLGIGVSPVSAATSSSSSLLVPADSSWSRVVGFNAGLAGRDLNGTALNGQVLDGHVVTGVALAGATLDGEPVQELWLDDSRLRGRMVRGPAIPWRGVAGLELTATLDDGQSLSVVVLDVVPHPDAALKDIVGYEMAYETEAGLEPLCGRDEVGAPLLAIALAGRWDLSQGTETGGAWIDDPTTFTFACEGFVLAKCVVAGYEPWRKVLECGTGQRCTKTTLARHHQACTRALRADYLGDGTSHTVDGTVLSIYDELGVRADTETWHVEATWDADGALCVSAPRAPELVDGLDLPLATSCDDASWAAGALLVTELPEAP